MPLDVTGLAREAVRIPGWWFPRGMRIIAQDGVCAVVVAGTRHGIQMLGWEVGYRRLTWSLEAAIGHFRPDLADDATAGVMLAMLPPEAGVVLGINEDRGYGYIVAPSRALGPASWRGDGATRGEAIARALLAIGRCA